MTRKRRADVQHRYKLQFDNGPDEYITATDPTAAVDARSNERLPYQITDETALDAWMAQMRVRVFEGQEATVVVAEPNLVRLAREQGFLPKVLTRDEGGA